MAMNLGLQSLKLDGERGAQGLEGGSEGDSAGKGGRQRRLWWLAHLRH